jgi:hypothetical protein
MLSSRPHEMPAEAAFARERQIKDRKGVEDPVDRGRQSAVDRSLSGAVAAIGERGVAAG